LLGGTGKLTQEKGRKPQKRGKKSGRGTGKTLVGKKKTKQNKGGKLDGTWGTRKQKMWGEKTFTYRAYWREGRDPPLEEGKNLVRKTGYQQEGPTLRKEDREKLRGKAVKTPKGGKKTAR